MIANVILTHNCNLCCKHCYLSEKLSVKDDVNISTSWGKILEIAPRLNIDKFNFTGGEVTTSHYVGNVVDSCRQNNYAISIFTNGINIPKRIIKECNEYWISLDGTESVHNEIRNNSCAFKNTMQSLEILKNLKKIIHIQTTVNKKNIECLDELIPIYESLLPQLSSISLTCVIDQGNAKQNRLSLNQEELRQVKLFKEQLVERLSYKVLVKDNLYTKEQIRQFVLNSHAIFPLWIDLIDHIAYVFSDNFCCELETMNEKWFGETQNVIKTILYRKIEQQDEKDLINIENLLV